MEEAWETEDERHAYTARSLPTPAETPRRALSKASRRSQRSVTPPPMPSSSPPRMPEPKMERSARGSMRDKRKVEEPISALDPRRFTPTLHASLVSEILALRRDQEEKLKIIETLELSLQESRDEQEALQDAAVQAAKESRSLKRQLSLLEGGTSSALGELAREREEAVDAIADTRKRLENAQKKVRSQEEDSERVHKLWSQEKDEWEEERRKYERKLHVADSRLKLVLEEVAFMQAARDEGGVSGPGERVSDEADGKDNDAGSVRTNSLTSSARFSVLAGPGKINGHSLADELNFDDDDDWQTDVDGRQSVLSHFGHNRAFSRDSIMSRTHQRNRSYDSPVRPGSVARRSRMLINQTVLERLQGGILEAGEEEQAETVPKAQYTDTGIQYSPPPSPELPPVKPATPEPAQMPALADMESPSRSEAEVEANQSRKRVYVSRPVSARAMPPSPPKPKMMSLGTQTLPESTISRMMPQLPIRAAPPPPPMPEKVLSKPRLVQSIATQTDAVPVEELTKAEESTAQAVLSVPTISIIPPTSRAASPDERRLPQYIKDFGCQVSISVSVDCKSAGTQTEEIRVDQRLDRLPIHLHPSTISSRPSSPAAPPNPAVVEEGETFTPTPDPLPPRNPRRLTSKRSFGQEMPSSPPDSPYMDMETHDMYPGNNDDGPLSSENAPMRRPHRISSLFAGFEASSDDGEDFKDGDMSDSEFQTALSAPRHTNSRQSQRSPPPPSSPEQPIIKRGAATSIATLTSPEVYSSYSLTAETREMKKVKPSLRLSTKPGEKPSIGLAGSRMSVMRKAAMIQNGIATHQGRTRSPSLTDTRDPPFPIPARASSRRPPNSFIAPADGQHSPTRTGQFYNRKAHRSVPSRSGSLRKSRSAAHLPRYGRGRRQGSRSPPPMSPSDDALESPGLPPLPSNDITSGRRDPYNRYKSHRSRPSTNTANTTITEDTNTQSVGSSQQGSSVVDAIAQTMVGEWMFKYVRRRKSFGMGDVKTVEENSNDRHRRWVWLAPYERSILWSSKQPVSGSALMGKPGRKLVIQSVLDVKDENPPPKGFTQIFNRSILILTPQRALKFTATSAERHYLWLTSLSFLAHSQQAVPDILPSTNVAAPPPPMGGGAAFEMNKPKVKRGGIRDSIRLTKGKHPTMTARGGEDKIKESQQDTDYAFSRNGYVPQIPHQRELSKEAAEPPFIPRFHERGQERVHERSNQAAIHGRKRSNTGGHVPPPISFRGFSGPSASSYHTTTSSIAGNSIGTAGSSDIYQSHASSGTTWGMSQVGSQRTSEASSRPPTNNFFEALGTVRMEAFISPLAFPRFEEHPSENEEWRYRARRRSKEIRRNRSRSRTRRDSYTSRGTRNTESVYGGSRTTADDDYFRNDPFRGF